MADDAVAKLEVAFAEFKGAVSSDLRNLSHDVKNLTQSLEAVVPRREQEKENKNTNDRISKLEDFQKFLTRQAIAQWIGGLAIGGTVFKKFLS